MVEYGLAFNCSTVDFLFWTERSEFGGEEQSDETSNSRGEPRASSAGPV